MDMQVNKTKIYFLTNQEDEKLRFQISGHEIQPVPKNTSVEYLNYWININGDDETNNKIETSSTIAKLNKLTNKKIPLKAKINIINNVIMKSPEYKWNFHMLLQNYQNYRPKH
jgi:hypothetical protein